MKGVYAGIRIHLTDPAGISCRVAEVGRESYTGVSQAACGIYQTAANPVVIQHGQSLKREWEVIRNSRNAEIFGRLREREPKRCDVCEYWLWCLLKPKLCVTPCAGSPINHYGKTKQRCRTPPLRCCHSAPDNTEWSVMTEKHILLLVSFFFSLLEQFCSSVKSTAARWR